ncbi:unnamed protein product [Eruca vesicaria subsp. sativa]|uniref:Uncharacterized protein n=1 Tax=Eruca vesicaria subsp. sativa TaxID=29727 RepID=A0ABC8JDB1_ERUVS|nr:unnamed protein product [Eruca vesicaria subsp. sativa]
MSVSEIVIRQNGDGTTRRVRIRRRAPPPKPAEQLDPDYVDPVKEEEYERQVLESDGFDVDSCPLAYGGIFPYTLKDKYNYPYDTGLLSRLGLHCYNLQKGTNLELVAINKFNSELHGSSLEYITLEAIDTSNNFPYSFQTCVAKDIAPEEASFALHTEISRLKVPPACPRTTPERRWIDEAVDDFYKGKMPTWSTIDNLPKEQVYELQESDLQENQWIHLYAEFAFHFRWLGCGNRLKSYLPLEFKKVIIQTKESGEESPRMKLKANNAIFYMSFKGNGDPSRKDVEYQAIVRRTMDGMPGHIRLELDCLS